ncbi:MAG: hypothetical protein H6828_09765 [Planctomycetes bacterium]|nr:hypothetical protein [Planctomycetota bacterium]
MKGAARLLAAVLACGGAARSGIVEGSLADLPAAGFELGLGDWTQTASDGGQPFVLSPAPGGGGWAASAVLALGVDARLALETPALFPVGTKLEARGRVHLDASVGAGDGARARGARGRAWVVLARAARSPRRRAPRGRWLPLVTLPFGATDARVPAGTSALRLAFRASAPGAHHLRRGSARAARVRPGAAAERELRGAGAWTGDGP